MHDYHTTTLLSSSTHPATTETPTLSLHDALPISAPADFLSAVCSSGDNFTSTIFSSPVRPSLHGTPQYIPESPYSPSSQAAHGSSRFWSSTIDSTICTTADDGG